MCARSLQMYDAVTSALLWEPRGPRLRWASMGFGRLRSAHAVHTVSVRWGRIYRVRAILLSCTVPSKCNVKKARGSFSAKLLSWRNNVRAQSFCLLHKRLPSGSACALSQKHTLVQWFPTRTTTRGPSETLLRENIMQQLWLQNTEGTVISEQLPRV